MALLDQTVELTDLSHSAERWLLGKAVPFIATSPKYIPMLQHFAVQELST